MTTYRIFLVFLNAQFLYNLMVGDDEICTTSLISEIDEGIVYCNCAVECNETEYEAKMSSSLWPSNYYEVDKVTKLYIL